MIHYFKPYDLGGKLFRAYNYYAELVKNPDDWICFLDGDTLFLTKDWGTIIQRYVDKYPDAGMLISYASRCSYHGQMPKQGKNTNVNILFHINVAKKLDKLYSNNLAVKTFNRKSAGHLMLIKKSVWNEIKAGVQRTVEERNKKILGVDTAISREILKTGRNILLMRGVYLLHLFRLDGRSYK